jgi:hypothetical protein
MKTSAERLAPEDELLPAARLIGADTLFLQLVERVATQVTGASSLGDAGAQERISALHEEFRLACAAIYLRHLGPERALPSLVALASPTVQRYLIARRIMAPALAQQLIALKRRMGNIET